MNVRARSCIAPLRAFAAFLAVTVFHSLTVHPATAQGIPQPSAPSRLRFEAGLSPSPPPPPRPPKAIPGTIQAEDFDAGANGIAYRDTTAGNSGGQYRATDVDIEACTEGGYDVGWIDAGEWLNYTVNVAASGTYTLEFRVASPVGGTLHVESNGQNKTGAVTVPASGGWQTWATVRTSATLSAGTQIVRVVFDTGSINVHAITVSAAATSPGPFGGTAWALPGTVQAEDFDQGGPGVAYYDSSPGNNGGVYRTTDVDIEATPNDGFAVGWALAGEWLRYTVNVATAGNYRLVARVASAGPGGTFHIEFNGVNRTGAVSIPNTGAWTAYQDVAVTVALEAGVQPMRVVLDSNGSTSAVGNFSAFRIETPPPPPPPNNGVRLRVATWNIHFGGGDTAAQAQQIASLGADIVVLQEASTFDEDMRVTYPERLRQATGQTWNYVWAGAEGCVSGCQGGLILSRLPIVDSSVGTFAGAATPRIAVDVNGVRVQVFGVHLEYFDTSRRTSQLVQIMEWARQFPGPRIVAGDFNSWWGESWIAQMETEYTDTWQDVTGSDENGYTLNGTVRFDYLFRSRDQSARVTPTACWVQPTNLSDHAPLVADYQVR